MASASLPYTPRATQIVDLFAISVNVQVACHAGFFIETSERDGVIDAILRHVAIGGPFAARDGEQAGIIDMDGVIAGKSRCLARIRSGGFHQRANANVHAKDVLPARWPAEIAFRRFEDEFDLLLHGQRIVGGLVDGGVGGADDGVAMPGNGEEHAAIAGMRHHDGRIARRNERSKTR